MGEHKLREANSDGDKDTISSHIVEVGDFAFNDGWGPGIEEMYTRLAHRAKHEDSFIVNTVQTVHVLDNNRHGTHAEPRLIVVLTAQRVSREDLERQQRMAQFGAGGPRR